MSMSCADLCATSLVYFLELNPTVATKLGTEEPGTAQQVDRRNYGVSQLHPAANWQIRFSEEQGIYVELDEIGSPERSLGSYNPR